MRDTFGFCPVLLPLRVLDKHIFTALCLRNDPAWKMLTGGGGEGGGGGALETREGCLADIREWPGSL